MRIIKLDAIGSTNDFLRDLEKRGLAADTVLVTAREQTNGKGQRGSRWASEPGKNIIMSMLVNGAVADGRELFHINRAVSLAVLEVLTPFNIPKLSVKWPNDIMAGRSKIGGILIENALRESGKISTVIGIGINANQREFHGLEKASSLSLQTGEYYDTEAIAEAICRAILSKLPIADSEAICSEYNARLFRIGMPTAFEDVTGNSFMGAIADVTIEGKLILDCEDTGLREFDLKEIRMLY